MGMAETVKTTCVLRKDDGAKMVWPDLRAMRASQSFYTGGLGDLARKSPDKQYGVWACVKDWNATQQVDVRECPGSVSAPLPLPAPVPVVCRCWCLPSACACVCLYPGCVCACVTLP